MEQRTFEFVEREVEQTLWQCIELKIEEDYVGMGRLFAKLLALLQQHRFISPTLKIIENPQHCLSETAILLESLEETQKRYCSRGKLLTHRQILNVWLRKNERYKREILPNFF
ncbi:MAG: transketolase [Solibacillus sp.]|uniref:transketolase n=1 Tax=Solibacillus sp. TaxID=1909654 RepID=UPI0033155D17